MQLLQMADDGLLLEFSGYYVINLLLYRQIINLFKSKNLLH